MGLKVREDRPSIAFFVIVDYHAHKFVSLTSIQRAADNSERFRKRVRFAEQCPRYFVPVPRSNSLDIEPHGNSPPLQLSIDLVLSFKAPSP